LELEDRLQYADIIVNKADYMDKLVEDLKLTYQLRQDRSTVERKRENLIELVRDSIIDLLNHPAYQHADIVFETDSEEVPFICDRTLLQRAISNLLTNALVHNPPATKIVVRVFSGQLLYVEIQDFGQGIPEADLENLFDRYYRGTNTGEAHKGSGLGMAIAMQIVEVHGGSIVVNSQIGQGTTVKMLFLG
jgi:signal transduction histidine kinase